MLLDKWFGFYVPAIPPKQAIGNMDREFIIERKIHLNTFLQELAKYQFFIDSQEFGVFANYSSEKLAFYRKRLPEQSAVQRLEKY